MIKKTITYSDLDGNKLTEDFYFNLSKAELIELEVSEKDGLKQTLEKIVKEDDNQKILAYFKKFLLLSVGRRSEDGKRFIKDEETRLAFEQSDAYSEFLMEMFTDSGKAAEFFNGLMPAGFAEKTEEMKRRQPSDYQKPRVSLKDLNK